MWLPERIDGVAMAMKAERSPAEHITKRTVDALRPGEIVWDDELKGFGVRCRASGAKYYVVKYRADGRQRWFTIGQHGSPWTIKKARDRAKVIRGKVADGTDPAVVRDEDRDELTISELCDLYLAEGCATKKPSTLATDKGPLRARARPEPLATAPRERGDPLEHRSRFPEKDNHCSRRLRETHIPQETREKISHTLDPCRP